MQVINLEDVKVQAFAQTTAPVDMIDAAKRSLSPAGFTQLMKQIGGRAPTRAELCAAADQERMS